MTTIVANKEMMVSDSKVVTETKSGVTQMTCPKITIKGKAIIGTCGMVHLGDAFIAWYGTKRKRPVGFGKDADFEALVLTEKGLYHFDEYLSGGLLNDLWFAVGSGAHAALGALHAGSSLEGAVQIACKVDLGSGLPLQVVRLADIIPVSVA